MTYGYELRRADQSIIADSTYKGGVFLEILTIAHDSSGSKAYPTVVGNALYFMVLKAGRHGLITSVNGLSQGVIEWLAGDDAGGETIVAVFAKDVVATSEYGIAVYGDDGAIAITGTHGVPQFLGTVQPATAPVESVYIPNGQQRHTHRVSTGAVGDAGMLVFFLCALPDSASANTWYAWTPWMYGTGRDADVHVYADPGASYTVPTLHMYALNRPPDPGVLYGLEVLDADGQRVFVSSENNMAVLEDFKFSFPAQNATTTSTVSMSASAGIFLPTYDVENTISGGYVQSYRGVVKRVGNQLTFNMLQYAEQVVVAGDPTVKRVSGNKNGNHGVVVDLSYYGAGSVTPVQGGPQFQVHPAPATAADGAQFSFSASATGTPTPTYQWYRNGTAIAGATAATYTATATMADDGALYKCHALNTVAGVFSNSAALTVQAAAAFTPVAITSHPAASSTAQEDSGQTITLYASASGTAPVTYQWYSAGTAGTTYTPISGATGTSYSPAVVVANDGLRFFCRARNTSPTAVEHTADSNMATITVTPASAGGAPTFDTQPSPVTVERNGMAEFSVSVSNATLVEWYRDDIEDSPGVFVGSGTSHTADTSVVGVWFYHCIISGPGGSAESVDAMLRVTSTVQYPVITEQPVDQVTTVGQQVYFYVTASYSTGYQWYRNGAAFGGNSSTCTPLVGSTGESGSQYWCRVFNDVVYTDSSTATLTVNAAPNKPVISTQPTGGNVAVGANKLLRCVASPVTAYKWYKDGVQVSTGQDYYPDTSVNGASNYYQCVCENTVGGATETTDSNIVVVNVGDIN